jgi:hypothetical protein
MSYQFRINVVFNDLNVANYIEKWNEILLLESRSSLKLGKDIEITLIEITLCK